jgi:hypothetical protein
MDRSGANGDCVEQTKTHRRLTCPAPPSRDRTGRRMTMKEPARWIRAIALAVVMGGLSVGAAQAQSYTARVTLPHEVQWGAASLPAGDYSLALDSVAGSLRVIDASRRIRALVRGVPESATPTQPASLLITRDGNERTVRSLNCPMWGYKFVYKPITRAERTLLAGGDQAETVAVRVASR